MSKIVVLVDIVGEYEWFIQVCNALLGCNFLPAMEVESLTCFMKVHYDLGSRQVFLVELYGLEEEDDPGCEVDLLGKNGIITATYSCNSEDFCNTVFNMMVDLEKISYVQEKQLQATAILRAIRRAQAEPVNRDFQRQKRTPLYIVAVLMTSLMKGQQELKKSVQKITVSKEEKVTREKDKKSKESSKAGKKGATKELKEVNKAIHKDEKKREKRALAESKDKRKEEKDKQKKSVLKKSKMKGKPEKPQVKTGGSAEKAKPSKRSGLQQKSKIVPPKDKQGFQVPARTKRSSETGGEKKKTLLVFLEFGWDQCDCLIKNMERPRGRENRVIYYDDLVADLVEKILDYNILKEDLLRTKTSKSENVIADNMHDNMQPTQPEEFDKVATGGAYYLDEGQDETIEDAPSLKRIYLPPSE